MFKRIFFILSGALQSNVLKLIFVYHAFSHTYKDDFYSPTPQKQKPNQKPNQNQTQKTQLISGNLGSLGRQNGIIVDTTQTHFQSEKKLLYVLNED